MKMTIPYNITGKQRKQLAEDISVALHTIPKYLGYTPSKLDDSEIIKMAESAEPVK